jgi:hypothetical protein
MTTQTPISLKMPNFVRRKQVTTTDNEFKRDINEGRIQTLGPPPLTPPTIGRTPNRNSSMNNNPRSPAVAIVNNVIPANNPRTPLVTPRIGFIKGYGASPRYEEKCKLKPGENPWIFSRNEGNAEIKITAITPIGTIAMVPTIDKRPQTPRRILPPTPTKHLRLKVIDENTGNVKIDPLLTAAIYLDCTKPEDQDYNHVSNKMRAITTAIRSNNNTTLQKQYSNQLYHLPPMYGKVSSAAFEEALSIYENNQVFYQDKIDDKTLDTPTIKERLTELEHWFMCIIEPCVSLKDKHEFEAWQERENFKITKGITSYCDPELYSYITPAGKEIKAFISQNH